MNEEKKYWGTETFLFTDNEAVNGYLPVLPTSINVSKKKVRILMIYQHQNIQLKHGLV